MLNERLSPHGTHDLGNPADEKLRDTCGATQQSR